MREAEVWRTLKPFQPSLIRPSGSTSASAAPSAARRRARPGRRSPPAARPWRRRRVTALGSLPSSLRSSPSHSTFMSRSTSGPIANTLPPLRATLRTRVAISGASQRMFEPTSRTTSAFSMPGDGRVERDRAEAACVVGQARLPPLEQGRPLPFEQLLRRVHGLGVEQVAGDRRDLAARLLQPLANSCERFGPARLAQLALLAHPRPVEAVADQRVDVVARLVVDPLLVHVLVDARQDAHHLALADVEADVGADRVHDVDAGDPPQLPRPLSKICGFCSSAPTGQTSARLPDSSPPTARSR